MAAEPRLVRLAMGELAVQAHADGRVNMFAMGMLGRLMGLPAQNLGQLARQKLDKKA